MKVSRPGSLSGFSFAGQRQRVVGGGGRPELHADRVADVPEQLDVGAVELPGALADPDEVRRDVVRRLGARVDAGHRVLVVEQQPLVAGVEVDPVELVGVGADGLHEGQRPLDLGGHPLVALADRRLADEVGVPGVHLAQVGVAAGDEGTDQVERRGRGVVDVDQPLRVGHARLGGEVVAVDGVAAVGRQGHALAGLEVGRARLGVLPRDPADLHDRHRRGVGQHDRHLQQHPQLVAHVVGGDAGERLGAVAAHEHERLAAGDRGDLVLQLVALTGEDQRRHGPQAGHGGVDGRAVGVHRLLGRAERAQGLEVGDGTAHRVKGTGEQPCVPHRSHVPAITCPCARCRGSRSSWHGSPGW